MVRRSGYSNSACGLHGGAPDEIDSILEQRFARVVIAQPPGKVHYWSSFLESCSDEPTHSFIN